MNNKKTICILETLKAASTKQEKEYRVAETSMNDVLYDFYNHSEVNTMSRLLNNVRLIWQDSPVFLNPKEAQEYSKKFGDVYSTYFQVSEVF